MNLTDCLSDLYSFFHYTTTPPAAVTTRLTRFLNDVQREILTKPGLLRLRDSVTPITATANVARSGLPPIVSRINGITDRTNNRPLYETTVQAIRRLDPAQVNSSAAPECWAPAGYVEVQFQPAAGGSGLWAVSSSAADTTQTAYIETVTVGGYPYRDTKALNGATRVQFGAVVRTDHIEVTRFYIGATAAGYISLFNAAAAGTELARIEPGKTFARYDAVEWFPMASADATLYCDFTRTITNLVNAFDEPLLPDDFHKVVVDGAMQAECLFINDARYAACASEYRAGLDRLEDWVMNDGARITTMRPMRRARSSLSGLSTQYPSDWGYWEY
jgi:hypothetical protein